MTGIAPVRWGVIGATSYVAQRAVLPALRDSPLAALVCVASRSDSAAHLARAEFDAVRTCATYDAVLDDPDVEAVYVPLPNALHREWVLRCAAAGKHVLCEKPLALTAAEAAEMAQACADAGVLLMEGYMTPFHPRHAELLRLARESLGRLRNARAVFTFPLRDPSNHRWRAEMGGGALLDVGIYCLAPLVSIAGCDPVEVTASVHPGGSGVDASTSGWLRFRDGLTASFDCSFEGPERQLLEISGSDGVLRALRIFTGMERDVDLHLLHRNGRDEQIRTPGADPYRAMVEHFAAAVRGVEPLRHGPEHSIRLLSLLDRVRAAAVAP